MPDDSLLTQIGVGGIFAILLIREARGIISDVLSKKNESQGKPVNGTAGGQPVTYWTEAFARIVREELVNHEARLKDVVRQVVRDER